jgi:hypothetical protein
MAFGSKEGTQVYFSFPSKAPAKEPLQIPYQGPHEKRGPCRETSYKEMPHH